MGNERKIGAVLSYIYIFITAIIGIIYTPFMLRYLGQSEYGLYSFVSSIIGYLTILDMGFGNAIIVYTSKYLAKNQTEKIKDLHGMFAIIYIIIGIISFIIGLIIFFNMDKMFSNTMSTYEIERAKVMVLILAFNLAITFSLSIYSSIVIAYEKFIFSKILSIIRQVLIPIIMLPLLILGYKAIAMTVVLTILNIVCLISNLIFCKKKLKTKLSFKKLDSILMKEIFLYSFFVFICTIAEKANWSIDQIVLGTVSGTIAVALYSVANQLNSIYLSFSNAITGVLIPKVTKMIENDASNKEISELFIKNGRIQYLILGLIMTGFIIFGQEFINLWAGGEYTVAYLIACILITSATITIIQNLANSILQAKNLMKFRSYIYIVIAIFNILISIPLSKLYGGVGAALGTAIALTIRDVIIMNVYYYKKIKLDIPLFWKNILKMTIPIIPILIAGYYINTIIISSSWLILFMKICIYIFIYSVVSYVLVMNNYEKEIIILNPINKIKYFYSKSIAQKKT